MRILLLAFLMTLAVPAYAADAAPPAEKPVTEKPEAAPAPTLPPSLRSTDAAGTQAPKSNVPEIIDITVEDAYAYATVPDQKNGAVFFTIYNGGTVADKLTAASTDIAESTDLHTNVIEEDTVTMTKVDGYDIEPKEMLTLDPPGHHIMLSGLKKPLKQGDKFSLQLTFEKKGAVTVETTVRAPGETTPAEATPSVGDDATLPAAGTPQHHH